MFPKEHLAEVLAALPDPAFLLSEQGRYIAVFGGKDARYYHDGSGLVGACISDLMESRKAQWFLDKIARALQTRALQVVEYELSNKDVKGLPDTGPEEPIWFEGRIQALDFLVQGERVVLWVASNITERHALEARLRAHSETDALTGLFNRRRLTQELDNHFQAFARYGTTTTVLLMDMDHFKAINDTHGHLAGDEALVAVARACRAHLRSTDIASRIGGDEFVIVLPHTSAIQAKEFANRLRKEIKLDLHRFAVNGVTPTVSAGVTQMNNNDSSYEDTLKRADSALYAAKASGGDSVLVV
ncbi:MAG: sensor domain-containing diguanylate cyclase [Limnohabitans sp.]|nr:MAG: sensor domain-containing diguanylate cyclase [Limnohabitans sp.]